jgi:hypothetical protein
MKKLFIVFLVGFIAMNTNAQKIKLVGGDIGFLKGQKELGVEFIYEDIKVGKMTEDAYIEKKVAEAEEREPGTGEGWPDLWFGDRSNHYEPKFIELFNDVMDDKGVSLIKDIEETNYTMVVETIFIEPGFNVGVARKSALINLIVEFVETDNPENVMATFTIDKSPGGLPFGGDYDSGVRVGEAYAKAGKYFAKYFLKKKAF